MKCLLKMAMVVMAIMFFAGCDQPTGGGPASWIDQINWHSHSGANAGFIVDNHSNSRLVAFIGSVSPGTVLGGIPARADNHGIYRDSGVFDRTRSITVTLVSEDDLRWHYSEGALSALDGNPFTRILVFYSPGLPTTPRHQISERIGGRHTLFIHNPTTFAVELRLNSPFGHTVGFAPPQTYSTVIHLNDPAPPIISTVLFPVFRFFHPVSQIVSEIIPVWSSGPLQGTPFFWPIPTGHANPAVNMALDMQDALDLAGSISLGAAWIVVENRADIPITVFQGNALLPNSMGLFQIPSNSSSVFVFYMRDDSGTFWPYMVIGNLWVGPTVSIRSEIIEDAEGNNEFTLRSDHRYTVTVTGNLLEGLSVVINLDGEPVDIAALLLDQESL